MTSIHHRKIVPYTREQMYFLINDISAYPQFLPWCSKTRIITQTTDAMTAEIQIKHTLSLVTRNTLTPYSRIKLELQSGPFEQFNGLWELNEVTAETTDIALSLEFSFSNKIFALTLHSVFEKIGHELMTAFLERARKLYGEG